MSIKAYASFLIFILSVVLLSCGDADKNKTEKTTSIGKQRIDSIVYVFKGEEGKSAFDLLQEEHEVDFIESRAGVFVNAVDSFEVTSKVGWMYSVNDTMGKIASDKYITTSSDIVKWHYRKF